MPTAAGRSARNGTKAARESKAVSTTPYCIEQASNRDYAKLPHDGFVYALVTGGQLLAECEQLLEDQKKILKDRDEYFKFMSRYFGIPVAGNFGHCGYISDLVLEVPMPKELQSFDWSKQTRAQYKAYEKGRKDFMAEHRRPFDAGEFGPWRIYDCYFSVPLDSELKDRDSKRTVLRLRVKPHLNKAGGRAEKLNLEGLTLPRGSDIASRIAPQRHRLVSRGPAPRGGLYMSNPGMATIGKHFVLRLPIPEPKPQPKTLLIDMGTAKRLTMSEFWQLREKVGK